MYDIDYEDAILRMQEDNDPDAQHVLTEDEKQFLKNKYKEGENADNQ